MWEIDEIIISGIQLIKNSDLEETSKKNIIWNLENLPDVYSFDAGMYNRTELDMGFKYQLMHPYEVGLFVVKEAKKQGYNDLVYDWSAFLLNYREGYFSTIAKAEELKESYLGEMKAVFSSIDFKDYKPIHDSLTIFRDGMDWFSPEQQNLVKWYCAN
ncbi:hypothetical protein BUL40_12305 [Croceivirga radicis]|uniref:DUF4375 domain-containing protein n=2 Tax=Croceivirga radicis TaxID=1929488 RepID=A0A1V6LPU9_9FLAO|nr:hypothetical protein BUL40_12305 [Croceivirga radicis]